jgi:DNA-binding transcriptional ArsR family regulator
MSFTDFVELTDPATIRALAHPARMAIISFLQDGPATATECSAAAERSPSSCSYHLRTLADLGFVEEVETADGRERRWRLKIRGHGVPKSAQDSPEVRLAARRWGRQWVAIEQRVLAEYLAAEAREPAAWQKAATFASYEVHLTSEELLELAARFGSMLEEHEGRADPENRPAGSRPVHFALTAFPRAEPAQRRRKAVRQARGRTR